MPPGQATESGVATHSSITSSRRAFSKNAQWFWRRCELVAPRNHVIQSLSSFGHVLRGRSHRLFARLRCDLVRQPVDFCQHLTRRATASRNRMRRIRHQATNRSGTFWPGSGGWMLGFFEVNSLATRTGTRRRFFAGRAALPDCLYAPYSQGGRPSLLGDPERGRGQRLAVTSIVRQ